MSTIGGKWSATFRLYGSDDAGEVAIQGKPVAKRSLSKQGLTIKYVPITPPRLTPVRDREPTGSGRNWLHFPTVLTEVSVRL